MKQNKDREELFNLCEKYVLDKSQSGTYDLAGYIDEEISELVDFVETHTQKKVKEALEKVDFKQVSNPLEEENNERKTI